MNQQIEAQDVFYAVADPTRRAILNGLQHGGMSVNEIAKPFPVSRPAISKHLRILLESNLVTQSVEGRQNIYRLNPEPLRDVDTWLAQYRKFWEINLSSLKKHVENKTGDKK